MADIEIACVSCSKTLKVSQFVDKSVLVCPYCKKKVQGENLDAEPASVGPVKPNLGGERRLKLKEIEEKPEVHFKSPQQLADEAAAEKKARKGKKKDELPVEEEQKAGGVCTAEVKERDQHVELLTHHRISWLVFIVLAGGAYFLRYGGGQYGDLIKANAEYCAWAILAMNVVVVVVAAKDSIFQSILGLLIPGYSFYWLFAVSDNFYLRAIFGGLMVGIGKDGGIVIKDVLSGWFNFITAWIQSGG